MKNYNISIIGLGYVGLPLAVEFAKSGFSVIGFDINDERIQELKKGVDSTKEIESNLLLEVLNDSKRSMKPLRLSSLVEDLSESNIFIITVPTPIDEFKNPDLKPLIGASKMIAKILKKGDIVIYESTVYPGCTEEECVPVLEAYSGLRFNKDFYCGYSPERINPGDKINTLTNIVKVTSGSTPTVANEVDMLYSSIIKAGTHKAPSIKVAEASKAIENAQRDVNISFVNELSLIFDRMNIDTLEVLEAASTKWNFLKFKPGLVGGHCIGVDPYYLAHKSESLGYLPQVILSGRRVNDFMGVFVANKLIKMLISRDKIITKSKVLVLGITFKENCPDIRNTKIVDVVFELQQYKIDVDVYDPNADFSEVLSVYGLNLIDDIQEKYDAIVVAVAHSQFLSMDLEVLKKERRSIIFDLKGVVDNTIVDARL